MSDRWDVKHGMGKRGKDFTVDGGATHGGASLSDKQIKERIFELFGKPAHDADKRRKGIPTHFAEVQGLLKNMKTAVGAEQAAAIETSIKKSYITGALQLAGIDVPPMGLVLPNIATVWIFHRHNGVVSFYGQKFGEEELTAVYKLWKLDGNELGDFHKNYAVYRAWTYYKDMAPPTVTAADANHTVVANFFGSGLQWDAWN